MSLFVVLLLPAIAVAGDAASPIAVEELRCEFRDTPMGIDTPRPRLSWKLSGAERGQRQTAYQVLVASTKEGLEHGSADLWDSGKVTSADSSQIEYGGAPLASGQFCYWKVRVFDQDDKPSAWSESARWVMGLLKPDDWTAKWIGAQPGAAVGEMPIFRRLFTVKKPVRRAVAFFCGLGQHELHLNGKRVSDDLLEPGWTNYRKTCLYVTYDIGDRLKPGENVVGVMLGNGMYNVTGPRYAKFKGSFGPPKLIGQIEIEYADGTHERLVTDSSWKASGGPITFSSIYGGEDYDARLEQPGWDEPGFNDSQWTAALEAAGPGGKLTGASHSAPPIRVMQIFKGQVIKQLKPDIWVYDLGQNCAIMPRITVNGPEGASVRITPGELLKADGAVSQASSGGGPAWFQYTLGSGGVQTWSPRFSYYGCRYLQVEGVQPQAVEVAFISSTSPAVGEFSCSNDLFNRTATLIRWAMRSNMMSILTDCPHRERLGWLEQDHLVGPSLMYNFSIPSMYEKVCWDMTDAQLDNGMVPDIAPEYVVLKGGFRDSPEWGSACVLLPWQLYQWYGDVQILNEQYPTMQRYAAYLGTQADRHIVSEGLGDWYDLGPKHPGPAQLTPTSLTATAFYYRDLVILEQTAQLLHKTDEAAEYHNLAAQVREAFNDALYHPDTHHYATASQTANALPLVMGLAPTEDRPAILKNLVVGIRRNHNRLTAGDIGYRYLLRALADGGRSDVIFDMNSGSDHPGYGFIINTGATALTEAWNGRASQDHFMLGHIMEWFYGDLAGIRCDPEAVAFRKIIIEPTPVGDVTWAKASCDSASGAIASSWQRNGEHFNLDVTIPPNTTATVFIPAKDEKSLTESGVPVAAAPGVHVVRTTNSAVVCAVVSGQYHFQSLATPMNPVDATSEPQ